MFVNRIDFPVVSDALCGGQCCLTKGKSTFCLHSMNMLLVLLWFLSSKEGNVSLGGNFNICYFFLIYLAP